MLMHLTDWVDGGGYGATLAGDYPRRSDDGSVGWTEDVGAAARQYRDSRDQCGGFVGPQEHRMAGRER